MSAKIQAAEDIKRLGKSLKGLMALAEELERFGSYEHMASEAKVQAEKARDELVKALNDKEAAVASLSEARSLVDKLVAEGSAKAKALEEKAQLALKEIEEKANMKSQALLENAMLAKDKVVSEMIAAKAKLEDVNELVKEKSEVLENLKAQIEGIRKKLL
jgi:hypothetical protein